MVFTNQDPLVQEVMATMQEIRESRINPESSQPYTKEDVAEYIEQTFGYRITADEYRAIEQGLTKRPPLQVILYFAHMFQVPAHVMFAQLGEYG